MGIRAVDEAGSAKGRREHGEALIPIRMAIVRDPRIERCKKHLLTDMVVMGLGAVLCGAEGWIAVEQWALGKEAWLRTFLQLPNGIPSHDTFSRVFARLCPEQLSECLMSWTQQLAQAAGLNHGVIAIDGKTLRRTFQTANRSSALHLLTAWASDARVVLAQQHVEGKSNEINEIPELLKKLDIAGCTVTIDAMGCQKTIVRELSERGADYVIGLKDNQPSLRQYAEQHLSAAQARGFQSLKGQCYVHDTHRSVDAGHGRIETRTVTAIEPSARFLEFHPGWDSIRSLVRVHSLIETDDRTTEHDRYYISSLPANHAELIASAVRAHWSIENDLHWTLDVQMNEDQCRIRNDHGPQNFATFNRVALSLLKQNKALKVGVKTKQLRAATDNAYLLKLLQI